MKEIDKKTMIVTVIVCMLPMIAGAVLYNRLPEQVAVHFGVNNQPDRYAHKVIAAFGIPLFLAALQIFCCVISDIRIKRYVGEAQGIEGAEDIEEVKGRKPRFVFIVKWVIPAISVLVNTVVLVLAAGGSVDIRRWICLLLGVIFIIMGNYMPKMSYEYARGLFHPTPKDEKTYRKLLRMFGYTFVTAGLLFILGIFFKPIFSVVIVCGVLLIVTAEGIWSMVRRYDK